MALRCLDCAYAVATFRARSGSKRRLGQYTSKKSRRPKMISSEPPGDIHLDDRPPLAYGKVTGFASSFASLKNMNMFFKEKNNYFI
jgi:hypothetical protein